MFVCQCLSMDCRMNEWTASILYCKEYDKIDITPNKKMKYNSNQIIVEDATPVYINQYITYGCVSC